MLTELTKCKKDMRCSGNEENEICFLLSKHHSDLNIDDMTWSCFGSYTETERLVVKKYERHVRKPVSGIFIYLRSETFTIPFEI